MNKKTKHALEVCKRVMDHACEIGDSEWSVYAGFCEARVAIEAAEQNLHGDLACTCAKFEDDTKIFPSKECSVCKTPSP